MRIFLAYVVPVLALLLAGVALWLYAPDKPRAALEAEYGGPPSQFLTVAGVRLHVRDTGPRNAPAVVFLHGFGSSLHTWEAWAHALEADHRVIRFDLPGFGLTGADPSGDYTDARSLAVVLALLEDLKVSRVSMVGNSMGGRIAWRFAAAYPGRVDKVVLISPDGFASPGLAYGVKPSVPLLLRALPYVLPSGLLRSTIAPAYADQTRLTDPVFARYRDMMLAPGVRRAIVDRTAQHMLTDPVPVLRTIAAPVLLLWGEQDRLIPVSNAADYTRILPHATLHVLANLGHVPQEEAPETVAVLRTFLDQPG